MRVYTTKGPIDHTELRIVDDVSFQGDCRVYATEWYLGDELVRRDVWANLLMPNELKTQQGG